MLWELSWKSKSLQLITNVECWYFGTEGEACLEVSSLERFVVGQRLSWRLTNWGRLTDRECRQLEPRWCVGSLTVSCPNHLASGGKSLSEKYIYCRLQVQTESP